MFGGQEKLQKAVDDGRGKAAKVTGIDYYFVPSLTVGKLEENVSGQVSDRKMQLDDATRETVSSLMSQMGWAIEER